MLLRSGAKSDGNVTEESALAASTSMNRNESSVRNQGVGALDGSMTTQEPSLASREDRDSASLLPEEQSKLELLFSKLGAQSKNALHTEKVAKGMEHVGTKPRSSLGDALLQVAPWGAWAPRAHDDRIRTYPRGGFRRRQGRIAHAGRRVERPQHV